MKKMSKMLASVNTQGEGASKTTYILNLEAVPDVLTGETVGDTSEFTAQSDKLKCAQNRSLGDAIFTGSYSVPYFSPFFVSVD